MNEQDVERLAEVLGEHYTVVFLNGVWCCPCGVVLADHEVDANLRKDRHLATVLAPVVAAARADGRESLAGEIRALAEEWESRERAVEGTRRGCIADLRALVAPTGHDGETGEAG